MTVCLPEKGYVTQGLARGWARSDCIISRDDFILHCEIKYRRTEYESSLGICCQILTRPNNYGSAYDIRCNKNFNCCCL
jgi:hypothetical protein